jgi:hypothetical protein
MSSGFYNTTVRIDKQTALRGPPPLKIRFFWKNIEIEFLAQEDAPTFLLPECI